MSKSPATIPQTTGKISATALQATRAWDQVQLASDALATVIAENGDHPESETLIASVRAHLKSADRSLASLEPKKP